MHSRKQKDSKDADKTVWKQTCQHRRKFGKRLNCIGAQAGRQAKESSESWTDRGRRNQERLGSPVSRGGETIFCKADGQTISDVKGRKKANP
jgi:outer membrane biogenesis lipoprotein LolB